jgi:hypothetical protein
LAHLLDGFVRMRRLAFQELHQSFRLLNLVEEIGEIGEIGE